MSEAVGYGVRGDSATRERRHKLAKVLNQHFYKLLSIHRLGSVVARITLAREREGSNCEASRRSGGSSAASNARARERRWRP